MGEQPIKKRVFILPNLLTAGNLFAGFYAIVAAVNYRFERAAAVIVIAGLLDGLDGKVARATGSTSKFGVEFDSLADLVSFGVAPAVLIYIWALQPYGRIGWVAAFLLVACGALRLARFNVQSGTADSKWFTGLPIPAAAGCAASTVLIIEMVEVTHRFLGPVLIFQVYLLAFLMVSSIRYRSFKNLGMKSHHPFPFLVSTVMLLAIVAMQPQITLFAIGVIYLLSGPVGHLLALARKGRHARAAGNPQSKTNA